MSTPDFFRNRIEQTIDIRDPLAVLATRMPWAQIEAVLGPKFVHKDRTGQRVEGQDLLGASPTVVGAGRSNAGRPKIALRLMASLLYLKESAGTGNVKDGSAATCAGT